MESIFVSGDSTLFLSILWDFADLAKFSGSATAQNTRSPGSSNIFT